MCTPESQSIVSEVYPVNLNFSRSLEEMACAANFDYVRASSWGKFPFDKFSFKNSGKSDVDLVLVDFCGEATVMNTRDKLCSLDLEPARLEHLLTFNLKYPDVKTHHDVVALGHPELTAAPSIFVRAEKTYLVLESLEGPWISLSDAVVFSGSVDDPPERHWDKLWGEWNRFLAINKN